MLTMADMPPDSEACMAGLLYDGHVVSGPSMLVVNVMGTEARVERCAAVGGWGW